MTIPGHGRKTDKGKERGKREAGEGIRVGIERGAPPKASPHQKGDLRQNFCGPFYPFKINGGNAECPRHSCKTPAQTRAQNNKNPWRKFAPRIPQESLAQICAKHFQKFRAQICARNPPGIFGAKVRQEPWRKFAPRISQESLAKICSRNPWRKFEPRIS